MTIHCHGIITAATGRSCNYSIIMLRGVHSKSNHNISAPRMSRVDNHHILLPTFCVEIFQSKSPLVVHCTLKNLFQVCLVVHRITRGKKELLRIRRAFREQNNRITQTSDHQILHVSRTRIVVHVSHIARRSGITDRLSNTTSRIVQGKIKKTSRITRGKSDIMRRNPNVHSRLPCRLPAKLTDTRQRQHRKSRCYVSSGIQ